MNRARAQPVQRPRQPDSRPPSLALTRKNVASPDLLICVALGLITLATLSPVVGSDFFNVLDDDMYVTHNPAVEQGLSWQGLAWAMTAFHANNWHPLTWLSLQLDAEMYGPDPAGFHLTSLLFHTANSLLLFGVLQRMTGARWPSAAVAAFFAIHPLHVESVAWVAERKDVLSTFFCMLTLWAYQRYVRTPSLRSYEVVVLAMALGLAAKPMLVTLPCVLLLLDYWPLRRFGWKQTQSRISWLVMEKVPLLALAVGCSIATLAAQKWIVQPLSRYPWDVRITNALVSYAGYLWQMIWPAGLAFYYSHPRALLPAWQPIVAGICLALMTAVSLYQIRRRPYLFVGWFWYLGVLVPVIGIVQVGGQGMADRYTYVPLIGIFMALAWLAADWIAKKKVARTWVIGAVTIMLAACILVSRVQAGYWQTGERMLEHTLAVTHDNYRVDLTLAAQLLDRGQVAEAKRHLDAALALAPDEPLVHIYLGMVHAREGRLEETARCYRKAIELNPYDAQFHDKLGRTLVRLQRFDEAYPEFEQALRLDAESGEANLDFAMALAAQGRTGEAIQHFREACRLLPGAFEPEADLGLALFQTGDEPGTRAAFDRAAGIDPARLDGMARALVMQPDLRQRNGKLGLIAAEAVCAATHNRVPEFMDTLAAAQAEVGNFTAAVASARAALELARQKPELARQIEAHLRLYEKHERFRADAGKP
jgi:tetratricopeptide (TPR) repeat protein